MIWWRCLKRILAARLHGRPRGRAWLVRVPPVAPSNYLPEGAMARGDVRIAVTLACEECKRRNYQTEKSKRNNPDRVELRKFCRWCRKHTPHKETR